MFQSKITHNLFLFNPLNLNLNLNLNFNFNFNFNFNLKKYYNLYLIFQYKIFILIIKSIINNRNKLIINFN